jgi:DNA-binding LytR/AlgR family response regulator
MKSENETLFRAIIIEDEIGEDIERELADSGYFTIVDCTDSVEGGVALIKSTPCDVIFLDLKIRGGDGLKIIHHLMQNEVNIPPIVITTGNIDLPKCKNLINNYNDFIIFILQKPFYEDWINNRERIVDKIFLYQQKHRILSNHPPMAQVTQLKIKVSNQQVLFLNPDHIVMVKVPDEPGKGTSEIILEKSKLPISLSLSELSRQLPDGFVQISRSHIIGISFVSIINNNEITLQNGVTLHINQAYKKDALKRLLLPPPANNHQI